MMNFKAFMESNEPIFEDEQYLIETQTQNGDVIDPKEIHNVIKKTGETPTIIGGHAFNVLAKTKRSTQDVDLLTDNPEKAAQAVLASYPEWHLDDRSHKYQQRILNGQGEEVVDILAYSALPAWSMAKTGSSLRGGYRIPNLETFIAMKWASFSNPDRSYEGQTRDESDMKTLLWQNMSQWDPASHATKNARKKLFDAVDKASGVGVDIMDFDKMFRQVEKRYLEK